LFVISAFGLQSFSGCDLECFKVDETKSIVTCQYSGGNFIRFDAEKITLGEVETDFRICRAPGISRS